MSNRADFHFGWVAVPDAVLLERIVDLMVERDSYRLLAQQAIHFCHAQIKEQGRLRRSRVRLINECRALRTALDSCKG